ncbi:MAG: hypothetical protein RIT02_3752 [Planctomycetota bacterium]
MQWTCGTCCCGCSLAESVMMCASASSGWAPLMETTESRCCHGYSGICGHLFISDGAFPALGGINSGVFLPDLLLQLRSNLGCVGVRITAAADGGCGQQCQDERDAYGFQRHMDGISDWAGMDSRREHTALKAVQSVPGALHGVVAEDQNSPMTSPSSITHSFRHTLASILKLKNLTEPSH